MPILTACSSTRRVRFQVSRLQASQAPVPELISLPARRSSTCRSSQLLKQLFLTIGQPLRHVNPKPDIEIAAYATTNVR
jgi:hypothetical protein